MPADIFDLTPPLRLAIAYAKADFRDGFTLLLAFDDRLAKLVGRSSEPLFAQMRIAWWYDVIAKSASSRPKAEPLLLELSSLEIASPALTDAMTLLLDAWGLLAANDDWNQDLVKQFAKHRSHAIFGWYCNGVGGDAAYSELGEVWAIGDLANRFGEQPVATPTLCSFRTPRNMRPLSILALAVQSGHRRVSGPGMIWHALTGR